MWKQKYKSRNKGFTLLELLITIAIVAILTGIGFTAISKVKGKARQTTCASNLRQITLGLRVFYNDFLCFPEDGYPDDTADIIQLSSDLASYISNKPTFVCSEDKDPTSIGNFASYDPYYVARTGFEGSDELVIGCPRHRDAGNSTNTFSSGYTEVTSIGTVLANGQEIPQEGDSAERSVGNVMDFSDGSTITTSGGVEGFLVQSVQLADGTLYSIVRVQGNGTVNAQVTSGSVFEIVTPSALVGVRGTQFTVNTSNGGYTTDVTLTTGTVVVQDRITGATNTLTAGGTTTIQINSNLHSHEHTHVDGTIHTHDHPSDNLAHHGNSAAVIEEGGGGTGGKGGKAGSGGKGGKAGSGGKGGKAGSGGKGGKGGK